jgi:YesN/AraC family two-component response regulator
MVMVRLYGYRLAPSILDGEGFSRLSFSSHDTYLIQVRIDAAKVLLKGSELPISDVCTKVGIEDPAHFVQLFKQHEGMTPAKYRKSR